MQQSNEGVVKKNIWVLISLMVFLVSAGLGGALAAAVDGGGGDTSEENRAIVQETAPADVDAQSEQGSQDPNETAPQQLEDDPEQVDDQEEPSEDASSDDEAGIDAPYIGGETAFDTSRTVIPLPVNGAYIGMNTGDEVNDVTVQGREALFGQQLAVERIFYPPKAWTNNIQIDRIVTAHEQGRIPMVSYKVGDWKPVIAGESDSIVDELADKIKASGIPVILTFHHEPENDACPNERPDCGEGQTAQDFVDMWRRIHDRFEAKGVENVDWNWAVMGWQVSGADWIDAEDIKKLNDMYPGDEYVDWVSGDIYNMAGNCELSPELVSKRWMGLAGHGQGWYDWASQFGKPLALAEWGTFHDTLDPERKAEWFADANKTIKSWSNVKAVSYFDRLHEGCDWRITTGESSALEAYKQLLNDPYYIKGN